jgi:hypothetical protein
LATSNSREVVAALCQGSISAENRNVSDWASKAKSAVILEKTAEISGHWIAALHCIKTYIDVTCSPCVIFARDGSVTGVLLAVVTIGQNHP